MNESLNQKVNAMKEDEFEALCKKHGTTSYRMRENLRVSQLVEIKSAIIVELRETHMLPYQAIADLLGYHDRSGARQAYYYAIDKYHNE